MTVTSTASVKQYTGNGSTTAFSFPYKTFNTTDFVVTILNTSSLVVTTQTNGGSGTYDYTVAVASDKNSATITFTNAPLSTHKVTIERKMTLTQSTDYTPNDPFPAETHEQALDERTLMVQQVQNSYETNAFRFDKNVTDPGTIEINKTAAERGNKLLSFDANGHLIATQEIGTWRGNWATSTSYTTRDIIKDTSNNNIYICIVDHTSSGSQPISSNTDVAKWALLVDAASATTSATAAATSATAAATSATASATSATASATSATSASSSASTATTQASNASTSASSASTSATNAATSYDNFDDRYLGQKSSDPSVNNDGDALITGALYFNTSNNVMMVYTGSAWVRTTPTSSDQTAINAVNSNASNINTVSGISSDVTAVAGKATQIGLLGTSDAIADMNTLGTADVVADMNTLANSDIVSDLNTLATSDVVNDMNILATTDVVNDMNVLGTSNNVTNMNTLSGISSDITAVAGKATEIGRLGTADAVSDMNTLGTADVVSDMNTLGTSGNVTAMSNCSGSISNINTVSSNLSAVNSFANTYRIASSAPSTSLDVGDLYFDTTADELKVYKSSGWAAAGSTVNGTSARFTYNITGTPNSVTGADANGNTLAYDSGFADVYLNGVRLSSADITITSGTSVVFGSNLTAGDVVDIVAYGTFNVASINASNINAGTIPNARISALPTSQLTGAVTSIASHGLATSATTDTTSASNISSGTLPDGRFPATLPTASGVNLTALNATNLGSGTVPTARLGSGTASSSNFLRGDGSWQTAGSTSASDLTSGTLPDGRFPATLPTASGANLTSLPAGNLTGTVADARISTLTASKLTGALPAISGASLTNLPASGKTITESTSCLLYTSPSPRD